jgi:hypothetical protein
MTIGCATADVAGALLAATTETGSLSEVIVGDPAGCVAAVELGTEEVDGTDATDVASEDGAIAAALGAGCGTAAGVTAGCTATRAGTVVVAFMRPHCIQASYPPAASSTTAATASSAFLLPPPADFAPLLRFPPNVNSGVGAAGASIEELLALFASAATASTVLSGFGIIVEAWFSVETMGFGSRAGAGALAALPPSPIGAAGWLAAISILGSAFAGEEMAANVLGSEVCAAGLAISCAVTSSTVASKGSAADSVSSVGTEATTLGCIAGF